jgi:hypothetical protein
MPVFLPEFVAQVVALGFILSLFIQQYMPKWENPFHSRGEHSQVKSGHLPTKITAAILLMARDGPQK